MPIDAPILARKVALEMIGEGGARKEAIVLDALQSVARRCAEIANIPGMMTVGPIIAAAIRREFGIKEE